MTPLDTFTATDFNTSKILFTSTIKKLLVKSTGPFSYSFPQPTGYNDPIVVSQPNKWKEKEININNNSSIEISAVSGTAFEFFKLS